jgi:CheY-like chemotaxis protein
MTKKILIVDDEPDVLELTKLLFEGAGFWVVTAINGEECFTKLAYEKPDLVLLDVVMKGMSGFEICEIIKKDPLTKKVPVVIYTVLNRDRDIKLSEEVGADAFINKPLTSEELLVFIKAIKDFLNEGIPIRNTFSNALVE